MSTAASLVKEARLGALLTQTALAGRSGILQAAISRAERGQHDITVGVLDRLVHASGWRLAVLPTNAGTAADTALACANYLHGDSYEGAYRSVIQLADWLASEHGAERVALVVAPPAPTGDRRFDAFLAGVVEHRLDEERLPHPRWLASAEVLDEPWSVDEWADIGDEALVAATPAALRRRGVLIDATELASV